MSTTLSPPPKQLESAPTENPTIDARVLEDKLPEHWRAPRILIGYTILIGVIYLFMNYRPIWHTDVWGHLAYGRAIWEGGALPDTEPLMPLANGIPFVDTAWLSQLVGFGLFNAFGVTALPFLYASLVTLCFGLLAWRFYEKTRSIWFTLIGLGIFGWVDWHQLLIVRPQLAGFACFVVLLTILTAKHWSKANWVLIPALFALWANLHGSFPVGLILLSTFGFGRVIDVARRTPGKSVFLPAFDAMLFDNRVRRYFLLTELAAAAVLLNPYGIAIYPEVASFATSVNLADLVEWYPLTLRMAQGQAAAVAVLALIAIYRVSPRRVSATEVLLVVGFGLSALWMSRMILWWAPLVAYYVTLHLRSTWRRRCHGEYFAQIEPSRRTGMASITIMALAWIFFGMTPFASRLLHGREMELSKVVSKYTPVAAVEHLKKNVPQGQVFNTFEWGDYLLWYGPKDLQVFAASHVHLIPTEVWQDYLRVVHNSTGWEDTLQRYGVNTVIVDYRYRTNFIRRMKREEDWQLTFDDGDRAAVFVRKTPILPGGNPANKPESEKEEV